MSPNKKILVVDDEPGIRELIQLFLEKSGYIVLVAKGGLEAIETCRNGDVDLILLDIEMPGMIGFEVCKEIRMFSKVPIMFVSSRRELSNRIEGIEMGADDYIMKPFDFHELGARIDAILRREKWGNKENQDLTTLQFNDIYIDLVRYKAVVRGKHIRLSNKEFKLLSLMAKEPNRIWPAEQLYDTIWGYLSEGNPETVKVHISNLRHKLELDPANPKYIQTVRGFGYKFAL